MPDIFVSFAREDLEKVRKLILGLEVMGYSVWWDDELKPRDTYSQVISSAIEAAARVLVVWSEASASSKWVLSEVKSGEDKLLPIRIDEVHPPNPYNVEHLLDFVTWTGDSESECWQKLRAVLLSDIGPRTPLIQEPRLALVVGVGDYVRERLRNPPNDARELSASLRRLGFVTELVSDPDRRTLTRAIKAFGQKLEHAGETATGLFYFAGHGMQWDDKNYLFPRDANVDCDTDLENDCIQADHVQRVMSKAGNRTNFLLLDACRNNPFSLGVRGGQIRGLASMNAPRGALISYATGIGQTALDGEGDHSPYTEALLSLIESESLPSEELFRRVRTRVLDRTNQKQTPWETTSLHGEPFYFRPPPRNKRDDRDMLRAEIDGLKQRQVELEQAHEAQRARHLELELQREEQAERQQRELERQRDATAAQLLAREADIRREVEQHARAATERAEQAEKEAAALRAQIAANANAAPGQNKKRTEKANAEIQAKLAESEEEAVRLRELAEAENATKAESERRAREERITTAILHLDQPVATIGRIDSIFDAWGRYRTPVGALDIPLVPPQSSAPPTPTVDALRDLVSDQRATRADVAKQLREQIPPATITPPTPRPVTPTPREASPPPPPPVSAGKARRIAN